MDRIIYDESNGLWYELHGEVYLPLVSFTEEDAERARYCDATRKRMRERYEQCRRKRAEKKRITVTSCEFNIDSGCVEVRMSDGSMLAIDCTAFENEVADNRFERSELDYLIYNDPMAYVELVLSGDAERYLRAITVYNAAE